MIRRWVPAGVATLFVCALLFHVHRPFLRHREAVCTAYATMARNHVRLGYAKTRLASYEFSAPDLRVYPDWRQYCYPNRPAVSVLITSLWMAAFGDSEAVVRLSLIAAALGSLLAFLKLAERILPPEWVGLAVGIFALNPMFWYFSIIAVHLVYALAFSLAAWACWVRFEDKKVFRILTPAFLFLACESDWPGYYATLSISIDAWISRRRSWALGVPALGLGCFSLHLLHLAWVDPGGGALVRRFLSAGAERSIEQLPGPLAFVSGELREISLYFTLGVLGLGLAGIRQFPRQVWLLALLGLDEILFMRWAHVHDYLTYMLSPFFALSAASGFGTLWTTKARKLAAVSLIILAAAQSFWVMENRLTREGAYEVNYRAGLAIRRLARAEDKVLITIADERQYTPYYADRYTAGVEPGEAKLMVHPSAGGAPVRDVEDLERFFGDFTLVLVGDPDRAASEIAFFKGSKPPPEFRFLDASHPLRKTLEAIAVSKESNGPFVLYRLR